ncbi:nucleotidyltransferase domain-containing protein [Aquibacillus rhizosphaerae]|uniref:Nucleotidyltransferase domain-containing protein n=1 Tax=Aquibacillus rhizosphaerae TaxID=3051431 RepID=A0ABT7LCA4_9BACI|nr:nucleotidyltransferase domain-containing protein [Aquibacillus sp. LR5S19]MDL4843064.1 nucleotidyltransferase domain-containing protein [Aquibacillus sp. LR5S19]
MKQEDALDKIVSSLKKDKLVKSLFLKGSMGRDEHDENSDIDLYCLIDDKDKSQFLEHRLGHLQAYRQLLFYDDIFIIAPQIIAVYDNLLHIDLFTVTEETFLEKDYFKVLYDPDKRLDKYRETQNLTLSKEEFQDDVNDVAWFLFRYHKAVSRGNDIWAVVMLNHAMTHLARVLLHRYKPNRAQLGLKIIEDSLTKRLSVEVRKVFECLTPTNHTQSVQIIREIVSSEMDWIVTNLAVVENTKPFLEKVITFK